MDLRSEKCCVLPKVALQKQVRRKTISRALLKESDHFQFHDQIENYLQSVHDDALQQDKKSKRRSSVIKPF